MSMRDIQWCKKCLMPSSRPRVVFVDGVCNACAWHFGGKRDVDWAARKQEFFGVLDRYRKHQTYDVVVPCSGGKDSAAIAHRLKQEYGANPLAVCYGQLLWTDVGRHNMNKLAEAGIDILYWRVNQDVSRKLTRRFFVERGFPKQAYSAAVNAVPIITAINFGVPLVCFAEMGELEYGGHILSLEHTRTRDLAEVTEHQIGDDPRNWVVDGVTERGLYPYIYPSATDINRAGVVAHYFSYYHFWDIYENARYARDNLGFHTAWRDDGYSVDIDGDTWLGRSDGSFESYDSIDDMMDDADYFMCYVKFLLSRSTRQASRLIQNGHITRDRGLELVRQFDGEYPRRYMPQILDYLGMKKPEFDAVVDKHRNEELWVRMDDGSWLPKFKTQ